MENDIEDEEYLYRVVRPFIEWVIDKGDGKPRYASSLFKNKDGVSVDRDGGRNKEEIIGEFKKSQGDDMVAAVVYVCAGFCSKLPTFLKPDKLPNNPYHAEIHDSKDKILISDGKVKRLIRECKIIPIV